MGPGAFISTFVFTCPNSSNVLNPVSVTFIFLKKVFPFHGLPIKIPRNLNYVEHPLGNDIIHCLIFPLHVAYVNRAIKSLLEFILISLHSEIGKKRG